MQKNLSTRRRRSEHGPNHMVQFSLCMIFHKFFISLLLVLLPAVCLATVQVEKVTIGLDGYVRAERWVPVVFQIRNTGEPFQGKIQVQKGNTAFEKSLDLGESTQKRVEILYYHSSFYESL